MRGSHIAMGALAIALAISLGWVGILRGELRATVNRQTVPPEAPPPKAAPTPAIAQPAKTAVKQQADVSNETLDNRKRISELEEIVAGKDRLLKRLQTELQEARQERPPAVQTVRPAENPQRGGFSNYMERLKTEDPERYEEMRERMKNFAVSLEERSTQQSDFIAELDLSELAKSKPDDYAKLQEGLTKMKELAAQMQQAQDEGEEIPRDLRRDMFMTMRDMQPMLDDVRSVALTDLAVQLGYRPENSSEFVDYVRYIYEMTSVHGIGRGGGGRNNQPDNNR